MDAIKKCSDCKFFVPRRLWHRCDHYRNRTMKTVSNYAEGVGPHEEMVFIHYTDELREMPTHCGPEAKWFEPKPVKPSLWKRLFG